MNFDFSDEQRLLKESVERLLADRYGFEDRGKFIASEGGFSRAIWQEYADLGLLALPFSEEDGGIGGGPFFEHLFGGFHNLFPMLRGLYGPEPLALNIIPFA